MTYPTVDELKAARKAYQQVVTANKPLVASSDPSISTHALVATDVALDRIADLETTICEFETMLIADSLTSWTELEALLNSVGDDAKMVAILKVFDLFDTAIRHLADSTVYGADLRQLPGNAGGFDLETLADDMRALRDRVEDRRL